MENVPEDTIKMGKEGLNSFFSLPPILTLAVLHALELQRCKLSNLKVLNMTYRIGSI